MGAAAPLSFLVCAALMGLIVTTIAVAGSRVSLTGGIYAYVEVAFGSYVGFLAGVLQWLTGLLAVAGVAAALLDQAATLLPLLGQRPIRILVSVSIFGTLAAVNARGVRSGARVIEAMTAIKLVPLLVFVGVGVFFISPSALAWPGWPGGDALGRSVLLLIFAYAGVEVAIAPSGEVRHPAGTVPRSVFLALAITTVLYISIQLVAQGVLGPALATSTAAPLADGAARFLGEAGRTLMLLGALCSMFGYVSGDMLSSPRSVYALARDGFLPRAAASIHPTWRTPYVAIWTHAVLAAVVASTNSFQALAIISNVAMLLLYLLCCGAALELTRRDVRTDGAPFEVRLPWLWPGAGAVLMLWILSSATAPEVTVTVIVLAAATLLYGVTRARSRPT
jgi:APA family basic amino acid/polyamine antiporter